MTKYNINIKTIMESNFEITADNMMEAMGIAIQKSGEIRLGRVHHQEVYFDEVIVKTADTTE